MNKDDKLYRFIRIFFIIAVKPPLYGHPPNTDTSLLLRTVCLVPREDSPLTFSVNSTRLMQTLLWPTQCPLTGFCCTTLDQNTCLYFGNACSSRLQGKGIENCEGWGEMEKWSLQTLFSIPHSSIPTPGINYMIGLHFTQGSKKHVEHVKSSLRWLDWMFLGGYLPSLSINFIRMSKDMGKRLTKLYYTKIKILIIWVLLQLESPWQHNDAITFFIYLWVSLLLYQEFF